MGIWSWEYSHSFSWDEWVDETDDGGNLDAVKHLSEEIRANGQSWSMMGLQGLHYKMDYYQEEGQSKVGQFQMNHYGGAESHMGITFKAEPFWMGSFLVSRYSYQAMLLREIMQV